MLINGGGKAVTKLKGWMHLQDAERKPNHQGIAAPQDQNHADTEMWWVLLKSHGWEMKEWVTESLTGCPALSLNQAETPISVVL